MTNQILAKRVVSEKRGQIYFSLKINRQKSPNRRDNNEYKYCFCV